MASLEVWHVASSCWNQMPPWYSTWNSGRKNLRKSLRTDRNVKNRLLHRCKAQQQFSSQTATAQHTVIRDLRKDFPLVFIVFLFSHYVHICSFTNPFK